ncbi:MAG: DUF427 domain-containing protein, partial [Egibacteraceae bacterium]
GGHVVAETQRPLLLFETGLPVRYYLPAADVRTDLLAASDTQSRCPYKGAAAYWHLRGDGLGVDDAAWSLPQPLPEAAKAADHYCFYPDKIELQVDGVRA